MTAAGGDGTSSPGTKGGGFGGSSGDMETPASAPLTVGILREPTFITGVSQRAGKRTTSSSPKPLHLTPGSARKSAHSRARPTQAAEQQQHADALSSPPAAHSRPHTWAPTSSGRRGGAASPSGIPEPSKELAKCRRWLLAENLGAGKGSLCYPAPELPAGSKIKRMFLTHLLRRT